MTRLFLIFLVLFTLGCQPAIKKEKNAEIKKEATKEQAVIIKLLPLGKTNPAFISSTFASLKQVIINAEVLPHEEMPRSAFYAPRNRYRADTLIYWMSKKAKENEVYAGITLQDISTTKGENPDYGIMGLGYQPGNSCVASSFRLRDKNNFFKVLIHELGHTTGLPHCPEKTCFMRDAEGGDPTGEEKEFCKKCKEYLLTKGWRL